MKTTTMGFQEMKDTANKILSLLNQSERQILIDLINQSESNPEVINSLRIYLHGCMVKAGR